MSLASNASHVELPTLAQIAEWSTVDDIKVREHFGLTFYQLLSEVKKIDNTRERVALQRAEEPDDIDQDSDTPCKSSDSQGSVELPIIDTVISEKAHSEDRATARQINMSVPAQFYGAKAIIRGQDWSIGDAFKALEEEFWCRNPANNPKHFIAGLCRPKEGDPGYQLYHELRLEIPRYFQAAQSVQEKGPNSHPTTLFTIQKAMAAIDSLYGDEQIFNEDGKKVHWTQALPKRVYWIVDRFCTPSQGANPILTQAALRLGIIHLMDIMNPGTQLATSIEGDDRPAKGADQGDCFMRDRSGSDSPIMGEHRDGPPLGDIQDHLSEDRYSTGDEHMSTKDDDAPEVLKRGLRHQRTKYEELEVQIRNQKVEVEEQHEKAKNLEYDVKKLKQGDEQKQIEIENLQSEVASLKTEVGQFKKHADEQEERHKKHVDEQEKRHRKHVDEQEDRHKKQLERAQKLLATSVEEIKNSKLSVLHGSPAGVSSLATTGGKAPESVEDVFGKGYMASTSQAIDFKTATSTPVPLSIPCGLFDTTSSGPSSPLDERQTLLKRKPSVQSSPTPTTPTTPTTKRRYTAGLANKSNTPRTPSNRSSSVDDRNYGKTDPRRKQQKGRPPVTLKKTPKNDGE